MCVKKTIAFFGHRSLRGSDVRERLKKEIKSNLYGEVRCLIGTHGEYDRLALSICRELKNIYSQVNITVVFTTLNALNKGANGIYSGLDMYKDVDTLIYDIEEEYFKNQIVVSNKRMVDDSDLVICYVDMTENRSGAKRAVKYAIKQGKEVVNLFREEDKIFYGMKKEEIETELQKIKNNMNIE